LRERDKRVRGTPIRDEESGGWARRSYLTTLIDDLLEYALGLAGKVDKAYPRSFNYAEIAGIYLDYGRKSRSLDTLAEALKTIETLKRPEEKSDRLAWVGRVYALAGDPVKAGESLSRAVLLAGASAPSEVVSGLYKAVCEYLDAGLRENAEKTARELYKAVLTLENDTDKALELINLADIHRELDQNTEAQEVLAEALKITLTLKDSWFKAERLIDAAREYLDLEMRDRAALVIKDAVAATGSTGVENQPWFQLKIVDLYIAADEISKALEVLKTLVDLLKTDEADYLKSKNILEAAERYHQLDMPGESIQLAAQALAALESLQEIEDKISGYAGIAALLGDLGQKAQALEIAGQAFEWCGKIEDKKTRVYLLGALTLLFVRLKEDEKAAQSISEILSISKESAVKNQGLGTVVMDLAAAGQFIPALRLVKVIRDPHIKSSAIANLAKSLIESGQENDGQLKEPVKEVVS
jgi:tetratricopeptide (TPR) repeat protein